MQTNLFSRFPFVLCNLLAADEGGGSGGGNDPAPPTPPEPTPPTPPEPEGKTLEDKLASAKTIIGDFFKRLGTALADLKKAKSDYTALEGQFNALKETADTEKTEHGKTKGLLDTEKTEHGKTKSELDLQKKKVARLESLCQLRGIDPNQAVPPASATKTGDERRKELVAQLEKETDPLKRGEIANELREFDLERKAQKKKNRAA